MRQARWLLAELGTGLLLLVRAARGHLADRIERDQLAARRTDDAFETYVWKPLPTLIVLAALTGLIAGAGARSILSLYHAELTVEPTLARVLAATGVPILFGVFAVGRIAVHVTVRLGAMRGGRELDALDALGHDPARYVLAPTLVAVVASTPIHIVAGFAAAWAAAGLVLDVSGITRWSHYVVLTLDSATARALLTGVLKALVSAILAIMVGATIGSRDERGAAAAGDQATIAFTAGLIVVLAVAALWAALG